MKKILGWEALKSEVERRRGEGQKIVFTNGCFDILHVGHVRYLGEARKMGNLLIVALNSDASVRTIKGDKRPLVPQNERAEVVASLEAVDYVTLFDETTPLKLIEYLRPDFLVKGGDWNEEALAASDAVRSEGGKMNHLLNMSNDANAVRSWGGKVVFIPLVEGASTTNIVEKVLRVYGNG